MAPMPVAIRASKLARKKDQASRAVKTPSRFSKSDDCTAVPAARPYVSSTGIEQATEQPRIDRAGQRESGTVPAAEVHDASPA
jgi:hypothetical protein